MTNRRRKRITKSRLLAYPRDWYYCIVGGFITGVAAWPIATWLFTSN